jgi:fatty-acyl-CoA synthase
MATPNCEERTASYACGEAVAGLLGETIGDNLAATARRVPDRQALVDLVSGQRWTYAQFDAAVDEVAQALLASGLARGDRIAIWAPNCAQWLLLQYGSARVGAILVCVNPSYRAHELAYVLRQSETSMLFCFGENRGTSYRGMVEAVAPDIGTLLGTVFMDDSSWMRWLESGADIDLAAVRARSAALSFDDSINIQYTSGTTGAAKGATLTHHNILNNGYFVGRAVGYTERDLICVPVPFYHCFGMVMANLAATSHGAAIVIPSANFDPAATLRAVEQERCTSLYGVPTMFVAELSVPGIEAMDLSSLRTGIMAGTPCPPPIMTQVMERLGMREIAICYGMTETSPVATMTRWDDDLRRRTETVGRPMPHVQVKIIDTASGAVVPRGSIGELCTRGYSVMRGYWREPEKTREALDETGWLHTGDLAVMDAADYVSIVGRSKDMVIRGGENIYPREIEAFLLGYPDALDVQVVGVPDLKYGEELAAFFRMRDDAAPPTTASIKAYCEGRLARYKIPRYVQAIDSFPMTVTGKVRKVELRQLAIERLQLATTT